MKLLDLPPELLELILQHCYNPWSIVIENDASQVSEHLYLVKVSGIPSRNLLLTCRALHERAACIQQSRFTGELQSNEREVSRMGLTLLSFMTSMGTRKQLNWIRDNLTTITFTKRLNAPSSWNFTASALRFVLLPEFASLKTVVLDCRYQWHFAVHNVDSAAAFLANENDALAREMDFRRSFYFKQEKFVKTTVYDGIVVRVVRAMGVREKSEKCLAVLVAVNYVVDRDRQLALDWSSLKTTSAVIDGWPNNIPKTVDSLDMLDVLN